jgi:hypothetical protein
VPTAVPPCASWYSRGSDCCTRRMPYSTCCTHRGGRFVRHVEGTCSSSADSEGSRHTPWHIRRTPGQESAASRPGTTHSGSTPETATSLGRPHHTSVTRSTMSPACACGRS